MSDPSIRVIITGATGMVGEGVLYECLDDPRVAAVLILNRRPLGVIHPKLTEVIHTDFFDLSSVEKYLTGYDACFFCLGISSVGVPAETYYRTTYTLTLHVAATLSRLNPHMVFCYVSGAGTDSSEKGRSRWARVKGKTENDIRKLPFRRTYGFRPGFIRPVRPQTHVHAFYKYIDWLYPIGRPLFPNGFNTIREIARAMVRLAITADDKDTITGKDITRLAAL